MIVFYRIERFPALFSRRFFLSNVVLLCPPTLEVIDTFGTRVFFSYPPILILFFFGPSLRSSLAS